MVSKCVFGLETGGGGGKDKALNGCGGPNKVDVNESVFPGVDNLFSLTDIC